MSAQAVAANGSDYMAKFAKARQLAEHGDDAAASRIYEALIKQDPREPQAYNNLAAIKARHGQIKQARVLLEKALRSNPVYATVYENLSAIYVEMARDSYGKALHLGTPQKQVILRELTQPSQPPLQLAEQAPVSTASAQKPARAASTTMHSKPVTTRPAPAKTVASSEIAATKTAPTTVASAQTEASTTPARARPDAAQSAPAAKTAEPGNKAPAAVQTAPTTVASAQTEVSTTPARARPDAAQSAPAAKTAESGNKAPAATQTAPTTVASAQTEASTTPARARPDAAQSAPSAKMAEPGKTPATTQTAPTALASAQTESTTTPAMTRPGAAAKTAAMEKSTLLGPPDTSSETPQQQASTQKPNTGAEKFEQDEVITTLQGWAAAWSGKAVGMYLSFYTPDYAPRGMTHAQWVAQRRQRLHAPKWISVSLNDFKVGPVQGNVIRVRLIQKYEANNYHDLTRKLFRLRHTADGWRIFEEKTLTKLR